MTGSAPTSTRPPCERLDDCRIERAGGMTTTVYYEPIYDGHGRNLNPDRNTTTWDAHCRTCGRRWRETTC